MQTRVLRILALSALLLGLGARPGLAQPDKVDPKEGEAIENHAKAFLDAFHKGDAKALAACWTVDGDYTDRSAPRAVIEMRLFVLDEQADGPRLVFQKDYRAAAPIEPASVSSLVTGWNQAMRSIMEQLEADLPSRLTPETSQQQTRKADLR